MAAAVLACSPLVSAVQHGACCRCMLDRELPAVPPECAEKQPSLPAHALQGWNKLCSAQPDHVRLLEQANEHAGFCRASVPPMPGLMTGQIA